MRSEMNVISLVFEYLYFKCFEIRMIQQQCLLIFCDDDRLVCAPRDEVRRTADRIKENDV